MPTGVAVEAVKVRVELALPPGGGVTGFVEKEAVTPLGRPVALSVVAPLKLLRLVRVTVVLPLPPWTTATDEGETAMVKSGVAAPQLGNLKDAMRVLQLKLPVVLRSSLVYQKVQSSTGSMLIVL
jgi:hypothetical protein